MRPYTGDDRLQDMLHQATLVSEMPVNLDVSMDADVSFGLEAGGMPLPCS